MDPADKEFRPQIQDAQKKRNSQGFSKVEQTPPIDAPSRSSDGRAMAQVLFLSQYKQRKRMRLETERNKQSLANDRHQPMQHISERDQSTAQGLESTAKDQEKHDQEAQPHSMGQRTNVQ